jgi:methyl-accepting chemotaxis protein
MDLSQRTEEQAASLEETAASEEQSKGIEQVNQAIAQMDQVTQQNAALVKQSSAAALSLKEQAGQMRLLSRYFVSVPSKIPRVDTPLE